ncbi:MAG: hypothetical protein JST01_27300 [Cyanobacteria bacterium SZAS TMP-1]|nr:hypothetical protein [Cyanobacteria bacterium SZAS TMP-1]
MGLVYKPESGPERLEIAIFGHFSDRSCFAGKSKSNTIKVMKTMPEIKQTIDWYDEVCHRLDLLHRDILALPDTEEELPPPEELYQFVKNDVQNIRRLAGFPSVETPDVWTGPDGEIGLTFEKDGDSLDLIYSTARLVAHLSIDDATSSIDREALPAALLRFAL